MSIDPITADTLDELLQAILDQDDPRRAMNEWKQAFKLLQKTDLPAGRVGAIVGMRDAKGLAGLIDQLRDPAVAAAAAGPDAPDADTCRKALAAFRKRAKFTRLDDESKLGRGPFSKGGDVSLGAVTPPTEWPEAVWQELVRQGKLRYLGHGMYEVAKA